MQEYVFVYRAADGYQPTEDTTPQWMEWLGGLGESIVTIGSAFGDTSTLGEPGGHVSGYSVVRAASLEDAVTLAKGCPGLATGGGVEIGAVVEM